MTTNRLIPSRHPTGDFFIADILDAAPKADGASMEHPIFALRAGDRRAREYNRNGITVTVFPAFQGCATIHDKDLWIYCISQLMEAQNRGREINRTIRFTMYDFLVSTNRRTDGDSYKRAGEMLERLGGTRIQTNIETDDTRERQGFGLIDSYKIVERDGDHRMVSIEITLPDWLFRAIEAKQVLTLSRDYFRLRRPLDRRIYELARKHCGNQKRFSISLSALHEKSGSSAPLKRFRFDLKELSQSNALPEYTVTFDHSHDLVIFRPKSH